MSRAANLRFGKGKWVKIESCLISSVLWISLSLYFELSIPLFCLPTYLPTPDEPCDRRIGTIGQRGTEKEDSDSDSDSIAEEAVENWTQIVTRAVHLFWNP